METPQEQRIEEKQEITNDVVAGQVLQTITTLHKNIDTNNWFPVARLTQGTGKTVEDFKTEVAQIKVQKEEQHLEVIAQLDAAIVEVDSKVVDTPVEK